MSNPQKDKLVEAYQHVIQSLKDNWQSLGDKTKPSLHKALEQAREKLSEWNELSREEIEHISDYVKRDLHEAGEYLHNTGKEFKDWLKDDLAYAETKLASMLAELADSTRTELDQLARRASEVGEWHTGEITGIGILECKACGEQLHFDKPGHIPPCPKCHGTLYKKLYGQE